MLSKKYRLTKKKDFEKVFQKGEFSTEKFIIARSVENSLDYSRFAFIVSLKISKKATARNKLRRQLHEIIRLKMDKIKPGYDAIIIVKPEIRNKSYKEIEKVLLRTLVKLGILLAEDMPLNN